ncbi:hypothetical protein MMC13_000138 [Lambiella insularis]|nr:hypothetical protein [Lambiella insularis]
MAQSDSATSFSTTSLILLVLSSFLALACAALFMTDAGKDLMEYAGERFFKYKAKAEEKALEKAGSDEVQGFLKNQLKKNPMVSNDELNEIQSGLGDQAMKEFGGIGKKGALGAMLGGS